MFIQAWVWVQALVELQLGMGLADGERKGRSQLFFSCSRGSHCVCPWGRLLELLLNEGCATSCPIGCSASS
jgi:hypothetical protein